MAAQTLLRRRQVRRSLTEWAIHCNYGPAKHHHLLINKLEAVARGEIPRLAVFMPPGSAKSTYSSILFPPWLLQFRKGWNVLAASHTTELAEKWGRRVRNLIGEHGPTLELSLSADSQAAGRWALTTGSEYYAAGVGTGIAGFRANLGLIDDPIRSRQDADSELIRDRVWDWYINDFCTRLVPGAAKVLIQCMVGNTSVLLADGAEKKLSDIRPGDLVATYEDGKISASKVLNWTSQGIDRVFTIKTISGITVTANERHPFLVDRNGKAEWTKLRNLRKGDRVLRVIGENGEALSVLTRAATSRQSRAGCATRTTINTAGRPGSAPLQSTRNPDATLICGTGTELAEKNTTHCLLSRTENVLSAGNPLPQMSGLIGAANCASIIATNAEKSEGCFATIATWQSDTERLKPFCSLPLNTLGTIPDEIIEIFPSGEEEVFDIQVASTENFIANGLVSHNTRWHEDDLAGRALNHEPWEVVSLPAEAEANDPLGRKVGEWLWSDDDYGYGAQMQALKATTPARTWASLYQQRPAPEEGDYFKADWLKPYLDAPALSTLRIYGGSDYAVTADGGDYAVHIVVGVDPEGRMYLLDLWRGQTDSAVWIDAFCDLVAKWKPFEWGEESGQILASVGPFLEKRMRERKVFTIRRQFPSRHDKAVRAQSIRGRMSLHGLYVPTKAEWYEPFRSELLTFPAAKHDDQVDALSLIGQLLDHEVNGIKPREPAKPSKPAFYMNAEGKMTSNLPIKDLIELNARKRRGRDD